MSLVLYGTDGCHLCDEAEILINEVIPANMQLTLVDIIDDDALYEKYQLSIPVLKSSINERSLYWPFTDVEIKAFLQLTSSSE